jgi:hypothetical protein
MGGARRAGEDEALAQLPQAQSLSSSRLRVAPSMSLPIMPRASVAALAMLVALLVLLAQATMIDAGSMAMSRVADRFAVRVVPTSSSCR